MVNEYHGPIDVYVVDGWIVYNIIPKGMNYLNLLSLAPTLVIIIIIL